MASAMGKEASKMEVYDSQVATHVGEEDPPAHGFILFLNPREEKACSWCILFIWLYIIYN